MNQGWGKRRLYNDFVGAEGWGKRRKNNGVSEEIIVSIFCFMLLGWIISKVMNLIV